MQKMEWLSEFIRKRNTPITSVEDLKRWLTVVLIQTVVCVSVGFGLFFMGLPITGLGLVLFFAAFGILQVQNPNFQVETEEGKEKEEVSTK